MAIEVIMPKFGLTMQEGEIVRWLKEEGETVAVDELLLEVETEKIVTEVPSPASGIVRQVLYPQGSTVPVGETIAIIEST